MQWLIEHIVRIVSERSLIEKVHEKAETPETILVDSAIRTLTAFVHEPELLAFIKQLKIIPLLRSLIALPFESIVFHTYVLLSYTLDEDDIKASEKESGRLLSNLFDSLRKKLKSLSKHDANDESTERSIALLVEALQGNSCIENPSQILPSRILVLVQHDQIKSEILKQNALSFLINSCQYFSQRSKRLLLESLGSMTFDQEVVRVLRQKTDFIQSMEHMQVATDDGIKKAAEKIIWNLSKGIDRRRKSTTTRMNLI